MKGIQIFFWYLGKYSWECMKTAVLSLFGMFLLASICSFACSHPVLMLLCVLAGYFMYNTGCFEDKED